MGSMRGARHGSGTAAEVVENVEPAERRHTLGTSPASHGGVTSLPSGAYSSIYGPLAVLFYHFCVARPFTAGRCWVVQRDLMENSTVAVSLAVSR